MTTALIEILGARLADLTGKSALACKGLVRIAIKDTIGDVDPNSVNFRQAQNIVQLNLKKRLEKINMPKSLEIIDELMKLLKDSQSLFVLGSV